jgi:hypothetical protein
MTKIVLDPQHCTGMEHQVSSLSRIALQIRLTKMMRLLAAAASQHCSKDQVKMPTGVHNDSNRQIESGKFKVAV